MERGDRLKVESGKLKVESIESGTGCFQAPTVPSRAKTRDLFVDLVLDTRLKPLCRPGFVVSLRRTLNLKGCLEVPRFASG